MPPQQNPIYSPNQPHPFVSSDFVKQSYERSKRKKYMLGAFAGLVTVIIISGAVFGLSGKHIANTKLPVKNGLSNRHALAAGPAKSQSNTAVQAQPNAAQSTPTFSPSHASHSAPVTRVASPPPPYTGSLPSTVGVYTSASNTYYYAGDRQFADAAGASVELGQYSPSVTQTGGSRNHSLMEMSVESSNGQQIVEVGWTVDPSINGDTSPHLFVFYWVNGQPSSCYNTCGFVRTNSSIGPGTAVAVGSNGTYSISYSGSAWYISYNGTQLGFFPVNFWGGAYSQMNFVNVFGEVELSNGTTTQCVQMGNGLSGSSSGSAAISNFSLIGSSAAPALSPYVTSPSSYSYGNASATGLNIGGPGVC